MIINFLRPLWPRPLWPPAIDSIGGGASNYAGARVAAAAVLGGTVSVMSGGKFANGALTAAFSRAFNEEVHQDILASKEDEAAMLATDPYSLPGIDTAKETKIFFGSGELLGYTQSGCSGDDTCVYSSSDVDGLNFGSVTLISHSHSVVSGEFQTKAMQSWNDRINSLSRNMPGHGDDSPLVTGRPVGIFTPGGYRYVIERRNGVPLARYIGGGADPAWGAYSASQWHPGINERSVARDYLRR